MPTCRKNLPRAVFHKDPTGVHPLQPYRYKNSIEIAPLDEKFLLDLMQRILGSDSISQETLLKLIRSVNHHILPFRCCESPVVWHTAFPFPKKVNVEAGTTSASQPDLTHPINTEIRDASTSEASLILSQSMIRRPPDCFPPIRLSSLSIAHM